MLIRQPQQILKLAYRVVSFLQTLETPFYLMSRYVYKTRKKLAKAFIFKHYSVMHILCKCSVLLRIYVVSTYNILSFGVRCFKLRDALSHVEPNEKRYRIICDAYGIVFQVEHHRDNLIK